MSSSSADKQRALPSLPSLPSLSSNSTPAGPSETIANHSLSPMSPVGKHTRRSKQRKRNRRTTKRKPPTEPLPAAAEDAKDPSPPAAASIEESQRDAVFDAWLEKVNAEDAAKAAELERRTAAARAVQSKLRAEAKSQFNLPPELMTQIMLLLDFQSRHSFALTCKDTLAWVKSITQEWNVSRGWFGYSNQTAKTVLGKRSDLVTKSAITVIHDDNTAPRYQYRAWELSMLKRMTGSVFNSGDKIRRLEFHKVPLLNTKLLSMLIPALPNLEYLGKRPSRGDTLDACSPLAVTTLDACPPLAVIILDACFSSRGDKPRYLLPLSPCGQAS